MWRYNPIYFDPIYLIVRSRFEWHRIHLEPDGLGTGGTIISNFVCGLVERNIELMVEDIVVSLVGIDDFDFKTWKSTWNQ